MEVVGSDVEDCFGSIPHGELLKALAIRIADGKILKLIKQWLKSGVMEEGQTRSQTAETPQGGVISPLLANVYLDKLDQAWKKGRMDKKHNAHLVRYADDLVVLTDQGTRVPEQYLMWILRQLGLRAHPRKTRCLNAQRDHFDFLGFNFRKRKNPKTGKWFTYMQPSKKAQRSLWEKLRRITAPTVQMTMGEVVDNINPVIRGWVNYFRMGHSSKVFGKVRGYTVERVRRCLRRRQGRRGYGWKSMPSEFFYKQLGLFYDYRVAWAVGSGRAL